MDENHPCSKCKFFRSNPNDKKNGFCHRYPRQYSNGYYKFSLVELIDWCGEWQPSDTYIIEED